MGEARVERLLKTAVELLEDASASAAEIDRVLSDCMAEQFSVTEELLRVRALWEDLATKSGADAGVETARLREQLDELSELRDELSMTIGVLRARGEDPIRYRPGLGGA